jgi:hypothetical protein
MTMKLPTHTLTHTLTQATLALALLLNVPAQADQQIPDDLVVVGSLCVGLDCVNNESFGFDTLRLKENNLRIKFQDTSASSSFPTGDWQITVNDSLNGGANWIGIEDIDAGTTPFTILASAPNESLYVSASGNIGLGTTTPLVDLVIKGGNTPTLRLEQDGTAGFTSQVWDVGGNETNFFVRDVTNGSILPFRIAPNAPGGSIYVAADGDVGFETITPDGQFDVAHSANGNNHAFLISPVSYVGVNIDNGFLPRALFEIQTTGGISRFAVKSSGDVGIGTFSPSGRFDVRDTGGTKSYFNVDASGDVGIGTSSQTSRFEVRNVADTATLFSISDGGQMGVGTTTFGTYGAFTPTLYLEGSATQHGGISFNSPNPALTSSLIFAKQQVPQWSFISGNDNSSDRLLLVNAANLEVFSIEQDGKIGFGVPSVATANAIQHSNGARLTTGGTWADGSSRATKNDIEHITIDAAKSALAELTPVTFTYKVQPDETYAGFIAEDVPEMVAMNDRQSLAPMDIVAVLTKVLQQQQKEVTLQQATIKALNERLDRLEAQK